MTPIPSTPYSRELGDELRQLREKHTTYTGTEMGYVLGWHQTKVSNVENGKTRASEIDIVQYLTVCKRPRAYIADFIDRYRHAFDAYLVQLPEHFRTLTAAERPAAKITNYDHTVIPGILQTEPYARALFELRGLVAKDRIEPLVRFRMQRQAALKRDRGPESVYFIHEQALQLQVGDTRVMEEQILRLLFKSTSTRIVPDSAGAKGAIDSSYVLWEYERDQPVAYTETLIGQLFSPNPNAVASCQRLFEHLDAIALDEARSRSLLMDYISRPREDPDEPDQAEQQLQPRLREQR